MRLARRLGNVSDHELVARVARGDERAFEELLRRYQKQVYGFAGKFLGDAAEAADIAQETFLRVYETAYRYRPGGSLKVYLMHIARNLCIDYTRRKKPLLVDRLPEQANGENPYSEMENKEIRLELAEAIQKLPENQRTAILLRHDQGFRYEEIARIMETSVEAVESLLVRARKALRERFKTRA